MSEVTANPFITQEQAIALGLTIGTRLSACLNAGSKLPQYHPGQEEISELKTVFEMIPVRQVAPGLAWVKTDSGFKMVEIKEVRRELTVVTKESIEEIKNLPHMQRALVDIERHFGKGSIMQMPGGEPQKITVVNETEEAATARLNVEVRSRKNNHITYIVDGKEISCFQSFGLYREVEKRVVSQKHIPAHVHTLVHTTPSNCYHVSTCTICGADETCDSGD